MGEAKRRGTAAERELQAAAREKEEVEQARKEAELPEDAIFCGFVVHIPEKDDYLGKLEDIGHAVRKLYAHSPEYALRYQSKLEAQSVAEGLSRRAIVGMLFEIGSRFLVLFDEE